MQLTEQHRRDCTKWYCILFYLLFVYKLWNGMLLFQLKPHLYNIRFDMVTWMLMQSGIHRWLIDNFNGWIALDFSFYIMPAIYWFAYKKRLKISAVLAFIMLLINWMYIECYTCYPANSIESFTAWLLFPFLLMTSSLRRFYFLLNGLRYFLLFFFSSAAAWKVAQSGLFNLSEMSGILLYQHKEFLASSPQTLHSSFIYWLIQHPVVSYLLYLSATVFEGVFIAGFFTKKYDKALIILFLVFLVMDVLIMRIPYWEVCPLLLTLVYSKYEYPVYSKV